jgi:hypothetical protein
MVLIDYLIGIIGTIGLSGLISQARQVRSWAIYRPPVAPRAV